jgi:cytochrome c oxidase subunit 1
VDLNEYPEVLGVDGYNLVSTIGSFVLAAGIVATLINAVYSVRHGIPAGHDPWAADTLEWFTLSPPPPHNFDAIPDVRSTEPMRDIRDGVRRRTESWRPPPPLERPTREGAEAAPE